MQLQSLCDLKTDEAVRERIGRLPPKLENLYMELYTKMAKYPADADRRITKSAFSWLLCAQRTLSSAEFLAMLSITPGGDFSQISKDQVLDICCNMVIFDSTLDTFRFAHLSVREFLEKQPEYDNTEINSLAAKSCLSKVIYAVPSPATEKFPSQHEQSLVRGWKLLDDFSRYPIIYWAGHCRLAAEKRTKGVLKGLFQFFLSGRLDQESAFSLWTNSLEKLKGYGNCSSPWYDIDYGLRKKLENIEASPAAVAFLASCFDFSEVVADHFIEVIFQETHTNRNGRTALHVAAKHGSWGVISALITNRLILVADKVVQEAAGNRNNGKEIVTLLLDRRGDDVKIIENVVQAAAGDKESGKEIITLLLDRR